MPAINKPNQHFDVLTWSGTGGGSGATRSITGLNFQPDFIWEKARSSGTGHQLLDSVRGVGQNKVLASNSTGDEPEAPNTESLYGWLSAINSDGFTLTNGTSTFDNWNKSGDTYVGWTWKAGGTAVTNTAGSITSQVSANPTAGFSVVTYTGTGANATVGHGLGVAPSMMILANRGTTHDTIVYHASLPSASYRIYLNLTSAQDAGAATSFNSLAPTSSVINLGSNLYTNGSGYQMVAYCFAAVAGYSAFASFVGNGTQGAGPFVYTGFQPKYVLIKNINGAYDWHCFDTARGQYNYSGSNILKPNSTAVELTARNDVQIDFLSNGFRLIGNDIGINQSGSTHIYAAFASAPFKYANAF